MYIYTACTYCLRKINMQLLIDQLLHVVDVVGQSCPVSRWYLQQSSLSCITVLLR